MIAEECVCCVCFVVGLIVVLRLCLCVVYLFSYCGVLFGRFVVVVVVFVVCFLGLEETNKRERKRRGKRGEKHNTNKTSMHETTNTQHNKQARQPQAKPKNNI